MQRTMFGSNEFKLRRWLAQQFSPEWCLEHNVEQRGFNDLIHDPEIRPHLGPFIKALLEGMRRDIDIAESERQELLANHPHAQPSVWGTSVPMVVPPGVQPFAAIKPLPKLEDAITATRNWAVALKNYGDDDFGADAEYYPPFLVLNGVPGCGKTMLALAAYELIARTACAVLFITEADMMAAIHGGIQSNTVDTIIEELQTIPCLILDDYGETAPGPWDLAKRDEVISARYRANGPRTMITTNMKSEDIRKQSPRMASRLMDKTLAVNVAIAAPDYRQRIR